MCAGSLDRLVATQPTTGPVFSWALTTLTLWKGSGQLFCRMSPRMAMLESPCHSGNAFLKQEYPGAKRGSYPVPRQHVTVLVLVTLSGCLVPTFCTAELLCWCTLSGSASCSSSSFLLTRAFLCCACVFVTHEHVTTLVLASEWHQQSPGARP